MSRNTTRARIRAFVGARQITTYLVQADRKEGRAAALCAKLAECIRRAPRGIDLKGAEAEDYTRAALDKAGDSAARWGVEYERAWRRAQGIRAWCAERRSVAQAIASL